MTEVFVTLNVPEDEAFLSLYRDLPITVVRNAIPLGFGANHNRAFDQASGDIFVVVNPDVRITHAPFEALARGFEDARVGACAPVVVAPDGEVEDSVRRFPSVVRLAVRVLLRRRRAEYPINLPAPLPIDWAAGMFVAFRCRAFRSVSGFDERYFMYFEDADICRRLWRGGWSVLLVPGAKVIHDAQRASHRSAEHLRWHLRSALRFLCGV